jgi:hypothetical protein
MLSCQQKYEIWPKCMPVKYVSILANTSFNKPAQVKIQSFHIWTQNVKIGC